MRLFLSLLSIFLLFAIGYTQNLVINEIQTLNIETIFDEDGDSPDWIEIYNGSNSSINLLGFALSDDPGQPMKWIFPEQEIAARDHLLLFASGKNRVFQANHMETVITQGDNWKHRLGVSEPPVHWKSLDFDDNNWLEDPSGFGFGDGDDATIIPQTNSLYIRKNFRIESLDNIVFGMLHVDYDDAFVAYLNGVEFARANVGQVGIIPPFDENSTLDHEALIYQGGKPELFAIDNLGDYIQEGDNVICIQVHNQTPESSDMTMIPFLTFGMIEAPAQPRGIAEIISDVMPGLHTNFKIRSSGERLFLSNPAEQIIDEIPSVEIEGGTSYGRQPDGYDEWFHFAQPTPGSANITVGRRGPSSKPLCSEISQIITEPVLLVLDSNAPAANIFYTTDSSIPSTESQLYVTPIRIDTTIIIRAMAIEPNKQPSRTVTRSFILYESDLPIISLVTNPPNLWDDEIGIYAMGNNAEPDAPYWGANFHEDWERPIFMEFFEPDGSKGFSINGGIKIHGGWTRSFPQKSLGIFARRQYGEGNLNYKLFPDVDIESFESIILRNSGSDWDHSMFRDPFMVSLMDDADQDVQAYRPSVVFLNGVYWGIHNIREKKNEHYCASHYNLNPDSVDVMNIWGGVSNGNNAHYSAMLEYLDMHSLAVPENYEYMKTQIDVDNFIDWNIIHIYINNGDWPGNNNEFWRPHYEGGRWRWFLYDTDFGFALHDDENAHFFNTLDMALEPDGEGWPNPPESTFLLRKLMESQTFKEAFINRFADFINLNFEPSHVLERIQLFKSYIDNEIPTHLDRWDRDFDDWLEMVEEMNFFAVNRPDPMRNHIIAEFGLSGLSNISIDVSQRQSGHVRINSKTFNQFPRDGVYFNDVPVELEAIPATGYLFSRWTGDIEDPGRIIEVNLNQDIALTAVFSVIPFDSGEIVINEISYLNPPYFNPEDWIEIYAKSGNHNLQDYILHDDNTSNSFIFPPQTILNQYEFLIVSRDTSTFKIHFPEVENYIGNLSFGLNSAGDVISLVNPNGANVDSVEFDNAPPWPVHTDTTSFSLELKDPWLPNELADNWRASLLPFGSPGKSNLYQYPLEFTISEPQDGSIINRDIVTLRWLSSSINNPGEDLFYTVELSNNSSFDPMVSFVVPEDTLLVIDSIPEILLDQITVTGFDHSRKIRSTKGELPFRDAMDEVITLYWKVKAITGMGLEIYSADNPTGWSFQMLVNQRPIPFGLQQPGNGEIITDNAVPVSWTNSADPESGNVLNYEVEWSLSSLFEPSLKVITTETQYVINRMPDRQANQRPGPGNSNKAKSQLKTEIDDEIGSQNVYWRVRAIDDRDLSTWAHPGATGWHFRMPILVPPSSFALLWPPNNFVINSDSVKVSWTASIDPNETDTVSYIVEWSLHEDFSDSMHSTTSDTFMYLSENPSPDTSSKSATWNPGNQQRHIQFLPSLSALSDSQRIHWRVIASDNHGMITVAAPGRVGWSFIVQLDSTFTPVELPESFTLFNAYPNPFNSFVVIPFYVIDPGEVNLRLWDIQGKLIFEKNSESNLGYQKFIIYPNNEIQNMTSGLYFVEISKNEVYIFQKIVLLK